MDENLFLVVCLGLLAFLSLAGGEEAAINLVKEGKSPYQIYVAEDAFPITLRAAQDLQLYLEKATGAKLPIRRGRPGAGEPAIVIGDGAAAQKAGVSLEGVEPEGFRIRTSGNNLFILGQDTAGNASDQSYGSIHWRNGPRAGTWHGVSHFLETRLGVRWFLPGDLGEYVPRQTDLSIPNLDITSTPRMIFRRMGYLTDRKTPKKRLGDVIRWLRRNKSGSSIVWQASHSWINWFKGEKYFKKHPDWFAMVDGRRLGYSPFGLQMCTTNSDALDEFARIIIEHGKKHPGVMFTLSPNDGGNHCQCAKCRALDVEKLPSGLPVLTDRYVTYCNEVAKRVCKVLPDQTFGFYAYSYYADPPRRTRLHKNVHVMEVLNNTQLNYYREDVRENHLHKRLIPWKKMVGQLFFYDSPEANGNLDLPCMNFEGIRDLFRDLHAAGVTGFSMNCPSSFACTGLNHYLYLKMAWNPSQDCTTLYEEALKSCYGAVAAPLVKKYFAAVEDRMKRFVRPVDKETGEVGEMPRRFPGLLDSVYPGLHEEGMPLLRKALAATADPGQQYRVQLLIDNLEYTRITARLYRLSRKVTNKRSPKMQDVLACRDLAKKRQEWIQQHDQTNWVMASRIADVEKAYNLPYDPKVYEYLVTTLGGNKKAAFAQHMARRPVIDGVPDEPAWQALKELSVDLDKDDASPSAVHTRARVGMDKQFLYISVRCDEPQMDRVTDSITKRDGKVWSENEIELFFDTRNAAASFRQICINSLGTLFDARHDKEVHVDWNSNAKVATHRGKDSWSLEMAVPLASLSNGPVRPGDIWGFNICRVRTVAKSPKYTCWSPTFGGFHKPERFGKLILRGPVGQK